MRFHKEIHKRGIEFIKIETLEQLGDMFTKGAFDFEFEQRSWDGDFALVSQITFRRECCCTFGLYFGGSITYVSNISCQANLVRGDLVRTSTRVLTHGLVSSK